MKDLPTLQKLFSDSIFKIPDYQRGYSWENQHRKDFLEDLESITQKNHYTGTIVLKENGDEDWFGHNYTRYDIVDGQQRITTILILLDIITKELKKINTEESITMSKNIRNTYINEESSQAKLYKMELDDDNDRFFKEVIIEDKEDYPCTIKSHERLINAKNQFQEYITNKKDEETDYLNFLKDLTKKLTKSLVFTQYKAEDNAEVGIIFEVMNDRGKPLSQLEKVKNRLLYLADRISENDIARDQLTDLINHSWKIILENLSIAGKSRNEDENQFLRLNYIINFYSNLKIYEENGKNVSIGSQLADIHKLMKKHFKELDNDKEICYTEIKKYISTLKSTSYKYKDIISPYSPNAFHSMPNKEDLSLVSSQLGRLDIQSNVFTLLLSIYEKYYDKPDKLLNLMKLCEIFAFRMYYISERRSYSAQTKIYRLANDIYNDKLSYEWIIREIKSILRGYAKEEEIGACLTDSKKDYYDWKGLRYFLYEYERLRCNEETGKRPAFEWEDFKQMKKEDSIEHILPQTIRGKKRINYWAGRFDEKKHAKNVKRLGNLTLSTRNSSLQNMDFHKKKAIYKDSSWQIERDLTKFSDWKEKQINERENELLEFAKKRWSTKI